MSKVRTLGPGSLKIGKTGTAQDFSADVINTALEPSTDTEDNDNFLDGHTEGGSQTETWALTGNVKEDFSMDGLQVWCLKHSGSVVIASIQFGGDVKTKNSNDFSFVAIDVTPETYTASA